MGKGSALGNGVLTMRVDLNTAEATDTELPPSGPVVVDGSPTRAPVVAILGGDQAALWLVDLTGAPCGAWVLPAHGAEAARAILSICDRRGLVTVDPGAPVDMIQGLAKIAGVDVDQSTIEGRLCSIPTLLQETAEARAAHSDAVRDLRRRDGKKLAPLVWDRSVPDPVPSSLDELAAAAGIQPIKDDGISAARQVASLTRWGITLWADTEGKRARRRYLRSQFGPTQPLPPSWRQAVKRAYAEPFRI